MIFAAKQLLDRHTLSHCNIQKESSVAQLFGSKDQALLVREDAFLDLVLAFTFSMVSLGSSSRAMLMPVRVFMKICIPPLRCSTKCRLNSWILKPDRLLSYSFF